MIPFSGKKATAIPYQQQWSTRGCDKIFTFA